MKGYFGIGVENVSKAMNAGAVMRTAHAFGANFSFFVGGPSSARAPRHLEWQGKAWRRAPTRG